MGARAHAERGLAGVVKRTVVSFYDDQMTHHAAALTYYGLMSLFPAILLGLSLLGLLGQYPETYDAIIGYLHEVAPDSVVSALDRSLEQALQEKGTAATTLVISVLLAFYGTTGVLEACRRALNVVFEVDGGRSFFQRKLVDVISTIVLLTLALVTGILVFVGGGFAEDLLGFIGLGPEAADVWSIARWPAALLSAMLAFSFIYFITPDVQPRAWHWITPGAIVGRVAVARRVVGLLDLHLQGRRRGRDLRRVRGRDRPGGWIWLTNVALLFGAELNAEIEREKELARGRPAARDAQPPGARGVTPAAASPRAR